ncbi:MAG TPA: ornithine cyclodeaminase family protein [Pedococcus sp.]|jgi:ornithine cyclodeaminase/alanine dehydrogenase|nr:ornithine cyclodeaminase family protein [Pedococcus sp.]
MRILSDADVQRLLPDPARCVELASEALRALADGRAEVPPKPAVHLTGGSFANAMPAAWPERDLLGCKWISIFPSNAGRSLPTASGLMVVNDATTGLPRCVMPAEALTAARTAAVSGACIAALAPDDGPVAITGAGVQARSHLQVVAALGRTEVVVFARRAEAGHELQAWAARHVPHTRVRVVGSAREAVGGAGIVITALPIGLTDVELDAAWVREDALLLPLDYASSVGPGLAASGTLVADHLAQFAAVRQARGLPAAYPEPRGATGALLGGGTRPTGRITCQNLGNGLSDLVVAAAVAGAADAQDVGQRIGPSDAQ